MNILHANYHQNQGGASIACNRLIRAARKWNYKMIKKLFSPFCVFISLLLLTYVCYKSEFAWQGARRDYYFSYYIISFSILIFSIFTFFLSEKIKIYLSIIFFSTFLTFYLFEVYLIFNDSTFHKAKIYKKRTMNTKKSNG